MVIKAGGGRETDALVARLASESPVTRDGAIARLTVIGLRAVERVGRLAADRTASDAGRVAALKTLEGIADARALDVAVTATDDPSQVVATAAVGVLRALLRTGRGVSAIDRLTALALNRSSPAAVRMAAFGALTDLDKATLQPLREALRADPNPELAALVERSTPTRSRRPTGGAGLAALALGRIPDDPGMVHEAIASEGDTVPLPALHAAVERIRDHEGTLPPSERAQWTSARAAVHLALARRGSRLGLYDVLETLGGSAPVPVAFLGVLAEIGDAASLEAIASAYARSARTGGPQEIWRRQLADTFRTIVDRVGVTRRHAAMKKLDRRWPGALDELWSTTAAKPRATRKTASRS